MTNPAGQQLVLPDVFQRVVGFADISCSSNHSMASPLPVSLTTIALFIFTGTLPSAFALAAKTTIVSIEKKRLIIMR